MTMSQEKKPPVGSVAKEKAALRRTMLQKARSIPEACRRDAGARITDAVRRSPAFRAARSVFLYVSMPWEPDTAALMRAAWQDGKAVFVPKCNGERQMCAVRVWPDSALVPGALQIPEPLDDRICAGPGEPELTIVPCVSASPVGERLGHGGGYYDAFLQGRDTHTICLCFRALLLPRLPTQAHDVRMDEVFTEDGPCRP